MDNMNKAQELKAHNVANEMFTFHMENERFSTLNVAEKLELLSDKTDTLKKVFKTKPFAQLVAKRLLWIMEDYVKDNDLCPDCFQELSYRTITRQTYWQPEEGEQCCDQCGWSEAL
ncbi:hypothetical protein CVD28_00235 [Bacillus sp. M6-12]|uniref:hypothetical protein n=1 Tax=Bacillus sp. M6-12 TaxID=2054166 RepID=UPI000C77E688|nr:hypothetical protein [Bacillus sp. M6-12]PLS18863.1 hypothetical protein CVD28_00235 [Bacillus sp. M6-12]